MVKKKTKKPDKNEEIKQNLKKISDKLNAIDKKITNIKKDNTIENNSYAIAGMLMAILFTVYTSVIVQDIYYIKAQIAQNITPNTLELLINIIMFVIFLIMVSKSIIIFNSIRKALYHGFKKNRGK